MKIVKSSQRLLFIDHCRAFLVSLVVLDHAMHAYSEHYAKYWFLPDFDRSIFFDVLHLHNDSFMMPSLFFLAGLFILPSLQRRGYLDFLKERALRLGVPFIIGVPLICPLLSYPKYKMYEDPTIGYWEYVSTVFIDKPQAGPFWFLYYLSLLTITAIIVYAIFPKFYKGLGAFCRWFLKKPLYGFGIVFLAGAVMMGLSDLIWGAPWWIGFGKLFYVRASRFMLKTFLFFLGIGFSECGLLQNQVAWKNLSDHWKEWTLFAVTIGIIYISYSLLYFDAGAYNNGIRLYFHQGGEWKGFWPVFGEFAPPVLTRTTLLTLFILGQLMAYLAIFHRFINHASPSWQSLAMASYGVYLIHEPFVVWTHSFFHGTDVPILIRFVISGFGSLFISWAIVSHGLLKIPLFRRIL
ncbi:MAG: acyltransferase family protein [Caedimonas sp.]|nr:acyltransferase family protein [Caedimonas sp.]